MLTLKLYYDDGCEKEEEFVDGMTVFTECPDHAGSWLDKGELYEQKGKNSKLKGMINFEW